MRRVFLSTRMLIRKSQVEGGRSTSRPATARTSPNPRLCVGPGPTGMAELAILATRVLALGQQGLSKRFAIVPRLRVVDAEAGGEFPVGPREASLLRLAGDGGGPADPGVHVGPGVGAELAEVDRPVVGLRPGRGLVEVGPHGLQLVVRAGPFRAEPFLAALGP